MSRLLNKLLFIPLLFIASFAGASTYFISSSTGLDSYTCTASSPCNTVKKAQSLMVPGDVLKFCGTTASPQTYALSSDTFNNTNLSTGSLTTYTTYMALNDGGVVITAGLSMLENSTPLQSHQVFEGFKFSNTSQKQIYGDHIAFKRCGFKDGDPGPSNTVSVVVGGNDDGSNLARYVLLEDCWFYGHGGRYKLLVFNSENIMLRRIVVKDAGGWSEAPASGNPEAAFAIYNSSGVEAQDVLLLDGTTAYSAYTQAFYYIHNAGASPDHIADHNRMRGIMVLDTLNLCVRADAATSTDNVWNDLVLADCQNGGFSFGSSTNTTATVDRFGTVKLRRTQSGDFMGGIGWFSSGGGGITNTNIIVASQTGADFNGVSATYFDSHSNGSVSGGVGSVTYNPLTSGWKYPPRIESGSSLYTAGVGSTQLGPSMIYQIGQSGTFWGEAGSSTTQTTSLWPWPNETRIKNDFAEMTPTWGWNSSTVTLSTWVWEYFGSSIPATVYNVDYTSPTVPGTAIVTFITTTTLSFGHAASTDNVGVLSYLNDLSVDPLFGSFVGAYNGYVTDATVIGGTSFTAMGLSQGTTYYYRCRAQDAAGNTSGNSGVTQGVTSTTLDVSSPTAPVVSTTAVTTENISIAWTASTDDVGVAGYYGDVSTSASFSTFVGPYNNAAAGLALSATVNGLSQNTSYFIRIRAKDFAGNTSPNSATVAGLTQALTHAPADISTTTVSTSRMGIFGINFNLYDTTTTFNTEINVATGMGMGRFRSNWDMMDIIHPSSATWNFVKMDWLVNQLNVRGLRISYYTPWRASWMTADPTCQSTNPFCGCGSVGITQCPTSDMAAYDVFITSVAQRYCNSIDTWEVYNEPDLLAVTTNTLTYVKIATHTIADVRAVCSGAVFAVPALANPRTTEFGGTLTQAATNYTNGCWFGDFLPKFKAALPTDLTLSSFTYSAHIYYEADGGHQTFQQAITTMTSILMNQGVSSPTFAASEYNLFGGAPSEPYPTYELGKSSDAMRIAAMAFSPNPLLPNVVIKSIIYHNIYGYDFSATTTAYAYRPVAFVLKRLSSSLNGYTAQGDQGDGSNVRLYKFTKGTSTTWIAWTESGTYSWALNPTRAVTVTNISGITTSILPAVFTPYTLTTAPIIVEVATDADLIRGFRPRGFRRSQ